MEHEIVNPYRDAYILKEAVCKIPFQVEEFFALLGKAAQFLSPPAKSKLDYARSLVSVRLCQRFMDLSATREITVDEIFLEEFRSSLENGLNKKNGKSYSEREVNRTVDRIRYLVNKYFYPRKLILRTILWRKTYLKYQRFFALSGTTQKLIVQFEEDGRKLKATKKFFEDSREHEFFKFQIRRRPEKLSASNRQARISATLTILSVLHKTAVEEINKSDLEKLLEIYQKKNKKEAIKTYLAGLFSLIGNGIDLGILKNNPFDNLLLERRKVKSRGDFIMPDQIKKLLDLESLHWEDSKEVRRRTLTTLIYDTGLRASAIAKLRLSDLHELPDKRYQLAIKGEYLKGEKEDKVLYILFQETIRLLRHWVQVIRPHFHPKMDRLFVSRTGEALTLSGVRDIVYDCCRSLDIRAVKGKIPSPHTFRHTLPTLNTEPYGKSLNPRLMQQRLDHDDFRTFERIYVHNNPLGEMEEYRKLYVKDIKESYFDKVSKEDFFQVLDTLTSLKPVIIREVKQVYERKMAGALEDQKPIQWDEILTEQEAISVLVPFRIRYRSLRTWGLREGLCQLLKINSRKTFVYDKKRINDLAENYLTSETVARKFNGSRKTFYRLLRRCRKILIGRRTLIFKLDFLGFLLDEKHRYTIRPDEYKLRYSHV